jgi:hypothetical protein
MSSALADALTKVDHRELADLVEEANGQNAVMVRVDRATHLGKRRVYLPRHREILDAKQVAHNAVLAHIDQLRAIAGKPLLYLPEAVRRSGGELVWAGHNLRTNVGIDYTSQQLGGAAVTTVAKYIGVSNNTRAPAAGDTAAGVAPWNTAQATDAAPSTTTGEYTALGVARAAALYAHTPSVASYTQSITYTATGTITSLDIAGMTDSVTRGAGSLVFSTQFTATSLANGDQLTLTWTVNA